MKYCLSFTPYLIYILVVIEEALGIIAASDAKTSKLSGSREKSG
jgi:hypothetical protein